MENQNEQKEQKDSVFNTVSVERLSEIHETFGISFVCEDGKITKVS